MTKLGDGYDDDELVRDAVASIKAHRGDGADYDDAVVLVYYWRNILLLNRHQTQAVLDRFPHSETGAGR
jgi:hypothetical protein